MATKSTVTSLARQLSKLKSQQKDEIQMPKKTMPSFIFDIHDAMKIDIGPIKYLAQAGFEELNSLSQGAFTQFKDAIFTQSSFNRYSLTVDELQEVDSQIDALIQSLCPYFLLPCCQKVLEFLIRQYEIHVYHRDTLIDNLIAFHENPLFIRICQIMNLKTIPEYAFLEPYIKDGKSINRRVITGQIMHKKEGTVLRRLCNCAIKLIKSDHYNVERIIKFIVVLILESLTEETKPGETISRIVFEFVADLVVAFKAKKPLQRFLPELNLIIAHICSISTINSQYISACFSDLLPLHELAESFIIVKTIFRAVEKRAGIWIFDKAFFEVLIKEKSWRDCFIEIVNSGASMKYFARSIGKSLIKHGDANLMDWIFAKENINLEQFLTNVFCEMLQVDKQQDMDALKGNAVITHFVAELEKFDLYYFISILDDLFKNKFPVKLSPAQLVSIFGESHSFKIRFLPNASGKEKGIAEAKESLDKKSKEKFLLVSVEKALEEAKEDDKSSLSFYHTMIKQFTSQSASSLTEPDKKLLAACLTAILQGVTKKKSTEDEAYYSLFEIIINIPNIEKITFSGNSEIALLEYYQSAMAKFEFGTKTHKLLFAAICEKLTLEEFCKNFPRNPLTSYDFAPIYLSFLSQLLSCDSNYASEAIKCYKKSSYLSSVMPYLKGISSTDNIINDILPEMNDWKTIFYSILDVCIENNAILLKDTHFLNRLLPFIIAETKPHYEFFVNEILTIFEKILLILNNSYILASTLSMDSILTQLIAAIPCWESERMSDLLRARILTMLENLYTTILGSANNKLYKFLIEIHNKHFKKHTIMFLSYMFMKYEDAIYGKLLKEILNSREKKVKSNTLQILPSILFGMNHHEQQIRKIAIDIVESVLGAHESEQEGIAIEDAWKMYEKFSIINGKQVKQMLEEVTIKKESLTKLLNTIIEKKDEITFSEAEIISIVTASCTDSALLNYLLAITCYFPLSSKKSLPAARYLNIFSGISHESYTSLYFSLIQTFSQSAQLAPAISLIVSYILPIIKSLPFINSILQTANCLLAANPKLLIEPVVSLSKSLSEIMKGAGQALTKEATEYLQLLLKIMKNNRDAKVYVQRFISSISLLALAEFLNEQNKSTLEEITCIVESLLVIPVSNNQAESEEIQFATSALSVLERILLKSIDNTSKSLTSVSAIESLILYIASRIHRYPSLVPEFEQIMKQSFSAYTKIYAEECKAINIASAEKEKEKEEGKVSAMSENDLNSGYSIKNSHILGRLLDAIITGSMKFYALLPEFFASINSILNKNIPEKSIGRYLFLEKYIKCQVQLLLAKKTIKGDEMPLKVMYKLIQIHCNHILLFEEHSPEKHCAILRSWLNSYQTATIYSNTFSIYSSMIVLAMCEASIKNNDKKEPISVIDLLASLVEKLTTEMSPQAIIEILSNAFLFLNHIQISSAGVTLTAANLEQLKSILKLSDMAEIINSSKDDQETFNVLSESFPKQSSAFTFLSVIFGLVNKCILSKSLIKKCATGIEIPQAMKSFFPFYAHLIVMFYKFSRAYKENISKGGVVKPLKGILKQIKLLLSNIEEKVISAKCLCELLLFAEQADETLIRTKVRLSKLFLQRISQETNIWQEVALQLKLTQLLSFMLSYLLRTVPEEEAPQHKEKQGKKKKSKAMAAEVAAKPTSSKSLLHNQILLSILAKSIFLFPSASEFSLRTLPNSLIDLAQREKKSNSFLLFASINVCFANLFIKYKASMVLHLDPFMEGILTVMEQQHVIAKGKGKDDRSNKAGIATTSIISSCLHSLDSLIESVPNFLDKFIIRIIDGLMKLEGGKESDQEIICRKIGKNVANKACINGLEAIYGKYMDETSAEEDQKSNESDANAKEELLKKLLRNFFPLLSATCESLSTPFVQTNYPAIYSLFAQIFEFEAAHKGLLPTNPNLQALTSSLISSFSSYVTKLNDHQFKEIFGKITKWVQQKSESTFPYNISRAILFIKLTTNLADNTLRSLFIPYFTFYQAFLINLIKGATENVVANSESIIEGEHKFSNLLAHCTEHSKVIFMKDTENTITGDTWREVVQVIVPQMELVSLSESYLTGTLADCLTEMFDRQTSEELWKVAINIVLQLTRHQNSIVRYSSLFSIKKIANRLQDRILGLLSDIVPYAAECLEDDHEKVSAIAKDLLRSFELMTGESMDQYLR